MMSAFFHFQHTSIDYLTIVQSYIDIRLVLLEIWKEKGAQIDTPPRKSYPQKHSLIRVNDKIVF